MPSTSVQIWISSAPMPAPTMDAVKSEPPRPSVVVTPSSVDAMKPPMTTTAVRGQRRNGLGEARVGFGKERRGLGVAAIGDDDVARIDMLGGHAEVVEGERDDVAREALAVARDGVDGARRQFAQHGEAFDEFGEFLEMVVEEAVELGAIGERDHLARFAGVEVAQVVELADVLVALAVDGRVGDGEQLVGGLAHGGDHDDGTAALRAL